MADIKAGTSLASHSYNYDIDPNQIKTTEEQILEAIRNLYARANTFELVIDNIERSFIDLEMRLDTIDTRLKSLEDTQQLILMSVEDIAIGLVDPDTETRSRAENAGQIKKDIGII